MVHSAVKRQRSTLFQSESTVPVDAEETQQAPVENPCSETDAFSPDDPKALLQALLKYLSDIELFNLIITRLAKAAPRRTPLFITTLCIEGVHDFFRPLKPVTDPLQLATPASADVSPHNPFNRMPITRRDSERLTGRFNVPSSRKNSPALLQSLATLVSFLEPAELRIMIQKRISDSISPHRPVACFLEFLQSGGEDLPWGKVRTMMKRTKGRENVKTKKVQENMGPEQAGSSRACSAMGSTEPGDADASMMPGESSTDAMGTMELPPSYVDIELEEGEISPNPDIDPPSLWPATHSPSTAPLDQGTTPVAPPEHYAHAPGTAPPPPRKKRKRKSNAGRRGGAHQEYQQPEKSAPTRSAASNYSSARPIPSSSVALPSRTSFPYPMAPKRSGSFHPDRRDIVTF